MDYKKVGKNFCNEINSLLEENGIRAAFVTGGGYAYDSIKYQQNGKSGDFDFMIVYDNDTDINKILNLLNDTAFDFEKKYLDLDKQLLNDKKIDIIRLSGNYDGIKSTINLVPKSLIERICNFEKELIIKKIAHNRNTSLFFAYGSDNSRITINFISPSFVTDDGEDHYIHLDFSHVEKNNNIYLGILADAILKGFNKNFDNIEFEKLRNKFIKNIHQFFEKNNINSNNYINLFANNTYFPEYLKQQLISEFNKYGMIEGKIIPQKEQLPIMFTIDFDINYKKEPFNFIRNKELKMNFHNYILLMQNNEYDRQYLIDAMGKFLGYLLSSECGNKQFKDTNILEKIIVYGTNDLFLPDTKEYNISSIVSAIIKELISSKNIYNNELIKNYLIICSKFLSIIESKEIETVISENKIDATLFNNRLDESKMRINIIKSLNSFNDIGTYHNYTSKVMPKYTEMEVNLLSNEFSNKNAKLLDIMCGYGRIANRLKKIGYSDITGIDIGDYNFLGVPKDFIFIKDNFLDYKFSDNYDYAYSLYNCYKDNEELYQILKKTYSLLKETGKLVIDCFNKSWRDSIDKDFYKELYIDENYKLIIKRDYDFKTGNELTVYELYRENIKIKDFTFVQKFFEIDDILDILDNKWSYNLANSNDSQTRNNSQKHIMILRKK